MIPEKFIILSGGRSGSTYLQQLLDSHPTVTCYDEIFNVTNAQSHSFGTFCKKQFPITSWMFLRGKISKWPFNFPLRFLFQQYIKFLFQEKQNPAVGFKLTYDQLLHYNAIESWLKTNSVSVIHLQRKNPLKAAISLLKAKASGIYTVTSNDNPQNKKINIRPSEILDELKRQINEKLKCEEIIQNKRTITIYYEDLFGKQSETIQTVAAFLKIDNNSFTKPDIAKTNPQNLTDVLENYEEVKKLLQGTEWEKYLD